MRSLYQLGMLLLRRVPVALVLLLCSVTNAFAIETGGDSDLIPVCLTHLSEEDCAKRSCNTQGYEGRPCRFVCHQWDRNWYGVVIFGYEIGGYGGYYCVLERCGCIDAPKSGDSSSLSEGNGGSVRIVLSPLASEEALSAYQANDEQLTKEFLEDLVTIIERDSGQEVPEELLRHLSEERITRESSNADPVVNVTGCAK